MASTAFQWKMSRQVYSTFHDIYKGQKMPYITTADVIILLCNFKCNEIHYLCKTIKIVMAH